MDIFKYLVIFTLTSFVLARLKKKGFFQNPKYIFIGERGYIIVLYLLYFTIVCLALSTVINFHAQTLFSLLIFLLALFFVKIKRINGAIIASTLGMASIYLLMFTLNTEDPLIILSLVSSLFSFVCLLCIKDDFSILKKSKEEVEKILEERELGKVEKKMLQEYWEKNRIRKINS